MLEFKLIHPLATRQMLGYIPDFLSEHDPRSAKEQLDTAYRFAGGWRPFEGFRLLPNGSLSYPGDRPVMLLASAELHGEETIRFYEHAWVMILQKDGKFEIARMD